MILENLSIWTISILLIFLLQKQSLHGIILCAELLNVQDNNYTLFMAVKKDLKNCKTDRSELDDLQNTNL